MDTVTVDRSCRRPGGRGVLTCGQFNRQVTWIFWWYRVKLSTMMSQARCSRGGGTERVGRKHLACETMESPNIQRFGYKSVGGYYILKQ